MQLTPNEMRNHKFSSSMRGYNKAEIEAFVESAAAALEEARARILQLTEEKESLEGRFEELKRLEETIKMAVIEAQKNAQQIVANANKEAELIVSKAKHNRDKAIDEKYQKMAELEARIKEIEYTKKSFYTTLRSEIEAHLKLIDSIYPSAKEGGQSGEQASAQPQDATQEPEKPEFEIKEEDTDRIIAELGENYEQRKETRNE